MMLGLLPITLAYGNGDALRMDMFGCVGGGGGLCPPDTTLPTKRSWRVDFGTSNSIAALLTEKFSVWMEESALSRRSSVHFLYLGARGYVKVLDMCPCPGDL